MLEAKHTLRPGRLVRLPLSLRRAPLTLSFMVGLRFWWWTGWRRPKRPLRGAVVWWVVVVVVVVWW